MRFRAAFFFFLSLLWADSAYAISWQSCTNYFRNLFRPSTQNTQATQAAHAAATGGRGFSFARATQYVDTRAAKWVENNKCLSCHTVLPYAFSRSRDPSAAATTAKIRSYIEKRVDEAENIRPWYDGARQEESFDTEAVISALMIASEEQGRAQASDLSKKVFRNFRNRQAADGSFEWLNFDLEPWESKRSKLFGNNMAWIALARANPEILADQGIQSSRELLKNYLQKQAQRGDLNLFDKIALLWADAESPDLLTEAQAKAFAMDVLQKQKASRGFSMNDFGQWRRRDPVFAEEAADPYATAYALYALKNSKALQGESAAYMRSSWKEGLDWLAKQQDENGSFRASSVNQNNRLNHGFVTDSATNFAAELLKDAQITQ